MVRWRFCQFDDFNDFQQLKVAWNGNLELPWAIFTLVVSINLVGLEFSSLEFLHPCFWYEWGRKNELGFSIRITNTTKKRRTFSWPLINYRIDVCYKHKIIFVSPPLQIGLLPAAADDAKNPDIFHTWDYLHASFDLISFQHLSEQNSSICFSNR